MELAEVEVAGQRLRVGEQRAEQRRIGLEGDGPDEGAAEAEEAGLPEGLDQLADGCASAGLSARP